MNTLYLSIRKILLLYSLFAVNDPVSTNKLHPWHFLWQRSTTFLFSFSSLLEVFFFFFNKIACRDMSCSQQQSRMSHICHMHNIYTDIHAHIHINKQKNSCPVPISQTVLMTTTHHHCSRDRNRNQDSYADTHSGNRDREHEVKKAICIGHFFFWINKQLSMSVP